MRKKIILQNGSIQNIPEIPTELKEIYKVSHEVKQKDAIEMSADRGAFIDQTQSLNIFMNDPNFAKLTAMHMYGWGKRSLMVDDNGQPIIPTGENIQVIYDSENKPKSYRDKKMALKTGMYYLRSNSSTDAVKFTVREEEKTTEEQISVGYSSYTTASNSSILSSLIQDTQSSFDLIMSMQIPEIVPFENSSLQSEFIKLSGKINTN